MNSRSVTWDAINKGNNVILSYDNLTATIPNSNNTVVASASKKDGKWYWEITFSEYSNLMVGVSNKDVNLNTSNYFTQVVRYYSGYNAYKYPEATGYGENYSKNDVISVLLDLDNGTLEFWKNGVSQGISHDDIHLLGEVYPTITSASSSAGGVATANFGATPFKYNMPSGYKAYSTRKKFLLQSKSSQYLSFENEIIRKTAIPKMTSNTVPSGRAFAKDVWSSSYDVWYAFNQVDDNDGYCSQNGSGGVGYLGYEFVQPIPIFKYALRSMGNSSVLTTMPKDWTFEGSNDGERWHILDTQKDQTWTTINTDKDYFIYNPKSFKMYRLNWTANNGHTGYTGINELKMYSGVRMASYIPTIDEKHFIEYGMDQIAQETLKNNYDKVQLISNKESNVNEGKLFEHEIDLKKYEVNKISTIVNKISLSGNGENYKNIAPKLIPSAIGIFSGQDVSDLYKAIEGDGILTSGKYVGFYSPTTASPVIFMLKPYGSAIILSKIRVAFGVSDWGGNTTASDFEVQISKNSDALINDPYTSTNWETIYSINGNSKKDFIEIKPATSVITPMIRIIIYKSAHSINLTISEIEVYGEEVNNYMLIKPEIDSHLNSVSDSRLIYLRNIMNGDKFTRYGFRKGESIDLTNEMENKMFVSDEVTPLGSGKVFRQKIDMSKIPIRKVSIE